MECMNVKCGNKSSSLEWGKGWPLRSGGFATLCEHCGSAYKQLMFCETFHSEDTGWRECDSCGKRLHCGCIASSSSLELLDTGGVICNECSKHLTLSSTPSQEKAEACCITRENNTGHNLEKMASDAGETPSQEHVQPSKIINTTSRKQEDDFAGSRENDHRLLSFFDQPSIKSAKSFDLLQESTSILNAHKSSIETDLCINLPVSSNSILIPEEREVIPAILSLERGNRSRHHLIPKLPNPILASGLQTNSNSSSLLRVARPPVEGRVKNQLLPRYWPRITDQELQQISGDSNSTMVPLFEKVLSASDAGRIGRLVLPKACAEAYFPPISQPEGLPLRIQDVKGKEWVFQFRFWPNNNSRMYVLEGVTPCIQSMQLRAGDTVTFSRMDPEGKLVMGFRKASNNMLVQQDSQSAINSGAGYQGELITAAENLPIMSGYSGLLQTLKGSRNSPMTMLSKHVCSGIEKETSKSGDNSNLLAQDRKRSRNVGSKGSKRLHIDDYDARELRLSWEEIQDMLLPPPSVKPSTISIEEYEFEEFDEPPVFAKRSIFIFRQPGEHEQWAQCDSCSKWRKLPVDFLLPSRWTCQDNVNDLTRNSCSAPDELDAQELEILLKMDKEFRNRRFGISPSSAQEQESQNLEIPRNPTLMSGDSSEPMKAMTTKHPRHRPGCSCIVCIQPPSGKGKHKPTCACNVCMTVKRRFKTLMMRKKKRQTEREAEIAKKNHFSSSATTKEEAEVDSVPSNLMLQIDNSDHGKSSENEHKSQDNAFELLQGGLDLNFCLDRENTAPSHVSMMSLLQEATLPLDTYLRENGLSSLISEQEANSTTMFSKETAENASQAHENDSSAAKELEEFSGKSSN